MLYSQIVELMGAFDKFVVYYEDILTHHIFYFKPAHLESLQDHIRSVHLNFYDYLYFLKVLLKDKILWICATI